MENKNILADCFSRLPQNVWLISMEDKSNQKNKNKKKCKGTLFDFKEIRLQQEEIVINNNVFASIYKDTELMEYFLNLNQLNSIYNLIQ